MCFVDHSKRPRVVVSKCLGFAHCRYNGRIIQDEIVAELKQSIEFLPICPEVAIGLGVPRSPLRIVEVDRKLRLCQIDTGRDLTAEMNAFGARYIRSLTDIDGFVLKSGSPSCGIRDVRIHRGIHAHAKTYCGHGVFAGLVMDSLPWLPIADELRLHNTRAREQFVTQLQALAAHRRRLPNCRRDS